MKGQWIGDYTGSSSGTIIINIDEKRSYFQGIAYLNEQDTNIPTTAVSFRTPDKSRSCQFRTSQIFPINLDSGMPDLWENVKHRYTNDITVSQSADVEVSWNEENVSLAWTGDNGVSGRCRLKCSKAGQPSNLTPLLNDWESYKAHVNDLEKSRYLFRGQNKPWRLRTSFHRTGRADLTRFLNEDIQSLHKQLSARTNHLFDLNVPDQNGAFFNLVQHHGYPTPLLDWSYSPYVAAFFAYRGITIEDAQQSLSENNEDKVRILVLDQARWKEDQNQVMLLSHPSLYFSIGEFLAIENERMIPQQAASTLTNVDDIESFLESKESEQKRYLFAIDLPVSDREKVVHELRYMGITAGSMFPGLDGACEQLKEQNFEI